jgi:hypothetical protein
MLTINWDMCLNNSITICVDAVFIVEGAFLELLNFLNFALKKILSALVIAQIGRIIAISIYEFMLNLEVLDKGAKFQHTINPIS